MVAEQRHSISRRLKFTTLVLVSQMLLIALAFTWLLQMSLIMINRSIYFIENNSLILYVEIFATLFIIIYAIFILASQIRRLGERRSTDRRTIVQNRYTLTPGFQFPTRDEIDAENLPLSK